MGNHTRLTEALDITLPILSAPELDSRWRVCCATFRQCCCCTRTLSTAWGSSAILLATLAHGSCVDDPNYQVAFLVVQNVGLDQAIMGHDPLPVWMHACWTARRKEYRHNYRHRWP